jgi:hypothetical protein
MRKLFTFEVPGLGLTYEQVYSELAESIGCCIEEACVRFAPDEVPAALAYQRRLKEHRIRAERLARVLGLTREIVLETVRPEGMQALLEALEVGSP